MTLADARVRLGNDAPERAGGQYVLYWMTAQRRLGWSHALDRAVAHATRQGLPLVILEALRCGHRWASDRLHAFVLDGMAEHARRLAGSPVLYHPYVEPRPGDGRGLLAALAARARVVVTDDFPAYFLPAMVAAAGRRLDVRLEVVDGCGLAPVREPDRDFVSAYLFRRHLQRALPVELLHPPAADPLADAALVEADALPADLLRRWPAAPSSLLARGRDLSSLPIDHDVPPTADPGGAEAGTGRLARFLRRGLAAYAEARNHPSQEATSGLSPYLHFGHLGAAQVAHAVLEEEGWSPSRLGPPGKGEREGWWGVSPGAEAFLDELVTWRELGFHFCARRDLHYDLASLPSWAQATLRDHAGDRRPELYSLDELEAARTDDVLWNAAQRQLLAEGRIHNYLRMLWGKRVLEWTASPREALDAMVALNDRWALDGRDPSSVAGILWALGLHDRAWGPERPVFGKVRYMSSTATRRKVDCEGYLERFGR